MSALNRLNAERNHRTLLELVSKPGNDVCADCKSRNPRWASYNIGIFICVNCASVHRKLGTHITKVKSLSLDEWTKEQVEHMRQNGNVKSNAYYNSNEALHPPPTSMSENERDSELEQYIRSKYEYKRFIKKSTSIASELGPSRSAQNAPMPQSSRAVSNPVTLSASSGITSQTGLGIHRSSTSALPKSSLAPLSRQPPARSASQPLSSAPQAQSQQFMKPMPPLPTETKPQAPSNNPVWDDLISLSQPSVSASLPLQVQAMPIQATPFTSFPNQPMQTGSTLGAMPSPSFQPVSQFQSGSSPFGTNSPMTLVSGMGMNTPMNNANPYQLQTQGLGYPLSAQPPSFSAGLSPSGGLMVLNQQYLQPQSTSAVPIQQPMPGFMSTHPQSPSPMSMSPHPMHQGFSTPSPMLQAPVPTGSPYGAGTMGAGAGQQPSMPSAPQQTSFGNYQQQQQPGFTVTPSQQQTQFTGWMQAPLPGQQPGGQQWGGF